MGYIVLLTKEQSERLESLRRELEELQREHEAYLEEITRYRESEDDEIEG